MEEPTALANITYQYTSVQVRRCVCHVDKKFCRPSASQLVGPSRRTLIIFSTDLTRFDTARQSGSTLFSNLRSRSTLFEGLRNQTKGAWNIELTRRDTSGRTKDHLHVAINTLAWAKIHAFRVADCTSLDSLRSSLFTFIPSFKPQF